MNRERRYGTGQRPAAGVPRDLPQPPHELQLEAPQLLQPPPPPATGAVTPAASLVMLAKRENTFLEARLHLGQLASSFAREAGRRSSNLTLHLGQQYS